MHFLNETVVLDERDSFLTISGDPDDDAPAWISGGAPLAAATTAWARWADVPNASCVWSRVVRVRSRRAGARARACCCARCVISSPIPVLDVVASNAHAWTRGETFRVKNAARRRALSRPDVVKTPRVLRQNAVALSPYCSADVVVSNVARGASNH